MKHSFFIIASIEETSPAQGDATYSISLGSDGEPTTYPGKTANGSGELSPNAAAQILNNIING